MDLPHECLRLHDVEIQQRGSMAFGNYEQVTQSRHARVDERVRLVVLVYDGHLVATHDVGAEGAAVIAVRWQLERHDGSIEQPLYAGTTAGIRSS